MGVLWTLQSSQPGLSFYSALPLAYGTSYYAISLSVNIVLTLLITLRLLQYRRTVVQAMSAEYARHYVSLVAVLIESAALYSVFALVFLITYAVNNPLNQIALAIAQASQQISTYMIIYRLADGSAWKTSTLDAAVALGSSRSTSCSSSHLYPNSSRSAPPGRKRKRTHRRTRTATRHHKHRTMKTKTV